jgi:hypothetical protein
VSLAVGVWIALAGLVAALPALGGLSRRRRLRGGGRSVWATVVPVGVAEAERAPPRRLSVQFTLDNGRMVERPCPRPTRKSSALIPGEKVLIWYDPADPGDMLVPRRDGLRSDLVFLLLGLAFVTIGLVLAIARWRNIRRSHAPRARRHISGR